MKAYFDADSIRSEVVFDDVHDGVIGIALCPIALPFEQSRKRRHRLRSSLDHSAHGVVVIQLTHVAAAILGDINFITVVDRLNCGQSDAVSVHRPERIIFFLPVLSIAAKFLSSQEFIDERSMISWRG